MSVKNVAYFLISAIAIVVILIYGQGLLIPFIFALLLWFIVRKIKAVLDKSEFIRTKVPSWLKSLLASGVLIVILSLMSKVLTSNINRLAQSYKKYEANVDTLVQKVNNTLNIDLMALIQEQAGDFDFGAILSSIFNSLTNIVGSAFLIIIYGLFIFLEEAVFGSKLKRLFTDSEKHHRVSEILDRIERSIGKYLGLKTVVSLITGILSYIVLAIVGIDSPVFWAFLIFIMNYIPTVGSIVATLFPAFFCLLQFGEFLPATLVLVFVGAIQVIVGNLIEPKFMGDSMNLSALVTIIALSFWGAIWGVTGMILSIPITVIIVIICSQFPGTRGVAIMLSGNGKIEDALT